MMHGLSFALEGYPVEVGTHAPDFRLISSTLQECRLDSFVAHSLVLNIFPSLDTPTCAKSIKEFNHEAGALARTKVLCISMDLPFAYQRFCGVNDIKNVKGLSAFRSEAFGRDYGVAITEGPLAGLLTRALYIIGPERKIRYREFVPDLGLEPDYAKAYKELAGI